MKNENEQKAQQPRIFQLWDEIIGNTGTDNPKKEEKRK